jgi:hypothetical protein
MRKLIAVLLLCLAPGLALAQAASPPPSVRITPPKMELSGVTMKEVAIVAGAMVVGAVIGEAIIGELVGDAVGVMIGLVGGYFIGSHIHDELDDETY